MQTYNFPCGCSFPIEDEKIKFNPRFDKINFDCHATWELIGSGKTKGIFQLESFLGQRLAAKCKPQNVRELADLISIMRPGTLKALMEDNKSLTEHYIMRKFGIEESVPVHPAVQDILQNTYQILIYQEDVILIAQKLAGFNLQDADLLRHAIGKKQVDKFAVLKTNFINGCVKVGLVNNEVAEQIFSWIEKSSRYSFNLSHAMSYSYCSYLSAYTKQHFPLVFFKHSLIHAKYKNKDKNLEIKEIIIDAKRNGIPILCPDIREGNLEFKLKEGRIIYGLADIKNINDKTCCYLLNHLDEIKNCNWLSLLINHLTHINSRNVECLIDSGSLDYLRLNRKLMKFQYHILNELTTKEIEYIQNNKLYELASLEMIFEKILSLQIGREYAISSSSRYLKIKSYYELLKNPPEKLEYTTEQIETLEYDLLKFPLSCTRLDGNQNRFAANTTCNDFYNRNKNYDLVIACIIKEIKYIKTKDNKDMCFITIMDDTGEITDVVGFANFIDSYKHHLYKDNPILLLGNRSSRNKDSLIAESITEI